MILNGLFLKALWRSTSLSVLSSLHAPNSLKDRGNVLPLAVSCSLFPVGGLLPLIYTHSATNVNPPLHIHGLPAATRSLSIVLEHRNTPIAPRTHWICYDIPPVQVIEPGEWRGKSGRNDFLINGYTGPLGPPYSGTFCFIVYALRRSLHLTVGASRYQVQRSIASELLAFGELPFYA